MTVKKSHCAELIHQKILQLLSKEHVDISSLKTLDNEIDNLLGLKDYEEIEANLAQRDSANIDPSLYLEKLDSNALNTSYIDLYQILDKVSKENPRAQICDLGAGHCRMSLLASELFPLLNIISVEPVKERISFAQSKLTSKNYLFVADTFDQVSLSIMPDYIFLYFPTGDIFESILRRIKSRMKKSSIIAIESHGELINRLSIEKSWLKREEYFEVKYPRHNPMAYIFRPVINNELSQLERLIEKLYSFDSQDELIINSDQRAWLASANKMEIHFDHEDKVTIDFAFPPRTVTLTQLNQVSKFDQENLSPSLKELINLRNNKQKYQGLEIRKIYPQEMNVELSDGKIYKI